MQGAESRTTQPLDQRQAVHHNQQDPMASIECDLVQQSTVRVCPVEDLEDAKLDLQSNMDWLHSSEQANPLLHRGHSRGRNTFNLAMWTHTTRDEDAVKEFVSHEVEKHAVSNCSIHLAEHREGFTAMDEMEEIVRERVNPLVTKRLRVNGVDGFVWIGRGRSSLFNRFLSLRDDETRFVPVSSLIPEWMHSLVSGVVAIRIDSVSFVDRFVGFEHRTRIARAAIINAVYTMLSSVFNSLTLIWLLLKEEDGGGPGECLRKAMNGAMQDPSLCGRGCFVVKKFFDGVDELRQKVYFY